MNRRRFVVSSISAAAVVGCSGSSVGSRFAGGGSEPIIPYKNTLIAQYATRNISGYRLRTRTYNGMPFGPTIEARPGQVLTINVVNQLPPDPPATLPSGVVEIPVVNTSMEAMMMPAGTPLRRSRAKLDPDNNPHGFNTTNLHVHGIQTIPHLFNPIGTSDPAAMMIQIESGQSMVYHFPVPDDHPSGLHWYHPHKHGSTDVQVSGGMAGLIVMRGPIDEVPEIKAAREFFVVVQSLNVNKSKTDPTLYEREYIAYKTKDRGGYSFGTEYTMLTVNGQGVNWIDNTGTTVYKPLPLPQYQVQPGEVIRLRLLNGTNGIPLALALPGFTAWQIGFDGVNTLAPILKDISGANTPVVDPKNLFTAPVRIAMEANRIELLIQAPATPGTYRLGSLPTKGIDFSEIGYLGLVDFVVSGDPVTMRIPKALPKPTREYPLITDADLVATRRFKFSQGPNDTLLMGFGFTINGELYEMSKCPTTVKRGTCEEWILENDTVDAHPFHLHMVSFQIQEINGVKNDPPEIWDTFLIPPKVDGKNGTLTIRMRFLTYVGKEVFHCHILPHEDTGMMQNFLVE